jgi:hypothetical protein
MKPMLLLIAMLTACAIGAAQKEEKMPQGIPEAVVPMGLGVNIHFIEPPPRDVDMIAAAGFRFIRMDFSWVHIERKKGEYDFSGYAKLVDALAQRGIRPLFILDYGNPLYDNDMAPHTDEGRQAFARFAAAGAAKFKGRGVLWELWNEPNIFFWRPRPNVNDYMALAKVALPAVRKADPNATIIAPATAGMDMNFMERCFEQGLLELIDAVSVHPYRRQPPETVTRDYQRLRALIARHAPKGESIPILSGEWGYSVTWIPKEQQGQYLARQFLTNLMNDVPLSIWYDWHDDGQDPKEQEHNFGTVTWDYQPKPAYVAAQTLIKELSGFRFTKRLSLSSENDYALLFSKGKEQKLALWTTGDTHKVDLNLDVPSATVVSMTGEKRTVTTTDGKWSLELSGSPQYLTPSESSQVLQLESAWRVESKPTFNAGVPASHINAPRLTVVVTNPFDKTLGGNVEAKIPEDIKGKWTRSRGGASLPARFRLKPRETAHLTWQGTFPRREDMTFHVPITLNVDGLAPMTQEVSWEVGNPLRMRLALRTNGVVLEVENPSGEPFDGVARLHLLKPNMGSIEIPLHLGDGERHKTLNASGLPPPGLHYELKTPLTYSVALSTKGDNQCVAGMPPLTLESLEWFETPPSGEKYQALLDGDAKVPAKLDMSVSDSPAPDAPFAKACRVDYDFGQGWRFLRVTPKKELPIREKPKAVGMWVYNTSNTRDWIRCRIVDATGQTFQPTSSEPLTWQGWKWIAMSLDDPNVGHWGGANDGVIHYPIRWDSIFLIDSTSNPHKGTVYFAGVTLIY